jgi:hydrogenase maturation protein HypF
VIGERQRLSIAISGAVQGIGFRPFVYRLASELGLAGFVINTAQGVRIEAEGDPAALEGFTRRLRAESPAMAVIHALTVTTLTAQNTADSALHRTFEIRHSEAGGGKSALIMPEMALCPDCLRELFTPTNRRYRYPFINCTNCGPRFTLIRALPYDRPQTTMARFMMCPACRAEYDSPLDRRFHAQPNACPECGPQLALWDPAGAVLATRDEALRRTEAALRAGAIVAVKGLGGFQLMVDARDETAVQRLRDRKHRPAKPLAVLVPNLAAAEALCAVSALERELLTSRQAPIVLLRRKAGAGLATAIAPGNPTVGVMLPYTPLQHLLMADLGFPVVATSGNLSGEPICIDEYEALERLGRAHPIADLFLIHDCPIERHMDDSVVQVAAGRLMVLRRARGYAPLPLHSGTPLPALIATGEQLKNTVAITNGADIFVSQHIGDMETAAGQAASRRVLADLRRMYAVTPVGAACSTHPDSFSVRHAESLGVPLIPIQHHYAHVLAAMAEHGLNGPVLGIPWDGTGYGDDGTIWGGECLIVPGTSKADLTPYTRVASLNPFCLPGGEAAIREPRRTALALLAEAFGTDAAGDHCPPDTAAMFTDRERAVVMQAIKGRINAPTTTSMGRLFDGVAALLGLIGRVSFEGQAAMALEHRLDRPLAAAEPYPCPLIADGALFRCDWRPIVRGLIADRAAGVAPGLIAARFHQTLIGWLVAVAAQVARPAGIQDVILTGGCFQNRALLEGAVAALEAAGFRTFWPQLFPPNDGGIALGQVIGAARLIGTRSK